MKSLKLLILLLLCAVVRVSAQPNILEKRVDFDYTEIPLEKVLKDLDTRYAIQFSYVNNMIPVDQKVTAKAKNKPLKQGLSLILAQTDVNFKEVNGQVVLRKDSKKKVEAPKPAKADEEVKEESRGTGAAENKTAASSKQATAQENKVTGTTSPGISGVASEQETIAAAEKNQEQEQVTTQVQSPASVQAETPNPEKKPAANTQNQEEELLAMNSKDSVVQVKKENKLHRMIRDVLYGKGEEGAKAPESAEKVEKEERGDAMPLHIGFTYPLSTNGVRAAEVANKASVHALVGVSKGIQGFEAAGIGSIAKEYVDGGQVAGLFTVTRDVKGIQVAGLTNITSGQVEGAQFAGILNTGRGTLKGGIFAGIGNIHASNVDGAQFAGIVNVAQSTKGIQAAGIFNRAQDIKGVQVSGIVNSAQDVDGAQIAGILNQAMVVKGVQIGLINVADSVDGASIGLLSFVKKGYRRFEVYGSESFHANAAFKLGTQRFYTIFAGGAQFRAPRPVYGVGIGFGSQQNLSEQWKMSIDLTAYQVIEDRIWNMNYTHQNANLRLSFDREFGRYFTLFGGPSFNVMTSQKINTETGQIGSDFAPWNMFDRTYSSVNIKMWPGFFAGFRF